MTTGVPIIDLDVTPPPAEPGPRPLRVRLAAARPIVVAAILALVLTTLGAAAPPAQRLVQVLSAGGTAAAAFALGSDSLYIAQFGANPSSGAVVRAFSLTDGSQRWSGGLPQNVQNLVLDPSSHVLMARSGTDPRIMFLDSDSGDTLWHSDEPNSTVVSMARGGVLVRTDVSATQTSLRLVDARTGRQLWTQTVDPTAELGPEDLYGDTPTRIVAVGSTGEVTVLNYADGAVLSQGDLHVRLPGQVDPFFQNDFVAVSTVRDRLYVSRRTGGHASMTAYSTVPLTKLWTIAGGPVGRVIDCGVVLCVADTRWVSGIDPVTGEARWAEPAWSTAFRYDGTRLFAYDQQETPESALLDASTGRLIRKLGHTFQLGGLMLKSDDKQPGRTWVGEVDPSDGALHAVGSLDTAAPFGCSVQDHYLACPTSSGPTTVWKVP